MEKYKQEFITFLVTSGALKFGDFTLKSGRRCPYFLNLGQFYKGSSMSELASYYAASLQKNVKDFDVIFGPAYKGIPLSVAIAMQLSQQFQQDVSYSFNRKEAKDHGEGGMLVGAPIHNESKVVIVDDVMTAGTALRESLELLKKMGDPQVVGVLIAVDRMEKGQGDVSAVAEIKQDFGVDVFAIVTLEEIVKFLYNRKIEDRIYIDAEEKEAIERYRELYGAV